ncbi:V-type ATP synthase subunit D [Amedibacillus dolichus]|uniref:V-type ATP synthase subunit D n=1 Tax=Amedibacillus dolichus DSM 3991 TaxID=428127 RepID=A8RD87_9FIRM|nr:V-type ATP synthase subunit D [Amedibacillus dolichus]EDP10600.1 V-type ATPase, D subunit [Amedibacillus dolichus DSM 3991]
MANKQVFPTKGNLIATKKSNALAHMGYELMDRKRNILIREMMGLLDDVKLLRDEITQTYAEAYRALQLANMSLGVISAMAEAVPIDTGLHVSYRSVMGVEIPKLSYDKQEIKPTYGLERANSKLDYAYTCFQRVKEMSVVLAEVENNVYRLANAIRKSQKRANALKNIVIPEFEHNIKFITDALEEKEREEFSRQKVIKRNKDSQMQMERK